MNANALTDYYQDAATFAGADHEASDGSCFFVVALSDRREFPELAATFGAQLTPNARLILHSTRQAYIDAIVAAQNV